MAGIKPKPFLQHVIRQQIFAKRQGSIGKIEMSGRIARGIGPELVPSRNRPVEPTRRKRDCLAVLGWLFSGRNRDAGG